MELFNFYKDFYFRELNNKDEINNSLSLPIGLITALVAGFFYLLTTFDYKYNWALTLPFILLIFIGFFFLVVSIYNLIKAYSDFPKGYDYSFLADTNDLDHYHQQLKDFYTQNPDVPNTSEHEIEEYILNEMIRNTGENQKNNK